MAESDPFSDDRTCALLLLRQVEEMERMVEGMEGYAREISLACQWHSLQRRASRLFGKRRVFIEAMSIPELGGRDTAECREHDYYQVRSHLPMLKGAVLGFLDAIQRPERGEKSVGRSSMWSLFTGQPRSCS
jgi:hypothetical protein